MDFSAMMQRVVRAVTFDSKFFEELRYNTGLTQEALYVVIAAAVATGIGAIFSGLGAILIGVIMVVVGYYIWSYVTLFVGKRLYNVQADIGQVQRALGYAYAPQLLGILGIIPCLGGLAALAGSLWSLALGVFAIRESMGLDTTKAIVTAIVGWIIIFIVNMILLAVVGGGLFALGAAGN